MHVHLTLILASQLKGVRTEKREGGGGERGGEGEREGGKREREEGGGGRERGRLPIYARF